MICGYALLRKNIHIFVGIFVNEYLLVNVGSNEFVSLMKTTYEHCLKLGCALTSTSMT